MKNIFFKRHEFLKHSGLFVLAIVMFSTISFKSFSQAPPPGQPDTVKTSPKAMPPDVIQQKSNTLGKDMNKPANPKLTPDQIKKIVGSDKPVEKDAKGRQLYEDSKGQKYYVNDGGMKIYIE